MLRRALHTAVFLLLPFGACECEDPPAGPREGEGEGTEGEGEEGEGEGEGDAEDAGFVGDSGVPLDCIEGLTALDVDPDGATVTLDGVSTPDLVFSASGTVNGAETPIDVDLLAWSVTRADDGFAGTISAGVFAPNPALGGVVTVTATDGCTSGSTTVTFVVDAVIGTPPPNPADWDGPPTTQGAPVPVIVYPSDQTRFPRNIFQTLFQWRAAGYAEFRLTFAGGASTVTVYTNGDHPLCTEADAACFEADELAWSMIAGSNAGSTVTWTVDALDRTTATPTVRRGESITIGFSLRDVKGAIFYWSTTSAGIRRANVGAAEPEDYITGRPVGTAYAAQGTVKCVACHTVSRDGRKIAAPVETTARAKSLWIMDVTLAAPPFPRAWDIADTDGHGFATFNPDTTRVMVSWDGALWLVDGNDGSYVAPVDIAEEGTQPDWSPDDTQVAYSTGKGDAPGEAAIALLPVTGADTFGADQILVEQAGDRTNVYPMFSPDSRWLAFSRGKGGHGDEEMQLFVVDAKGSLPGAPLELVNANRVVSNELTDGQHQNAAPTWAPPGDLYWVAFNSVRGYGLVNEQGGTQQIWVAAIDPTALENGAADPSYPAFRLQFQGLEEDNHRAFWTLDVREEPPPVDAGPPPADAGFPLDAGQAPDAGNPPPCVATGDLCDPVFDTCCNAVDRCLTFDDGETYTCVLFDIGG